MSFSLRRTRDRRPRRGSSKEAQVVAREGRDKPGFIRFGPYVPLQAGAYLATFSLAARGVRPEEPVAIIQVGAGDALYASKVLTGRQLRPLPTLNDIELPFATPGHAFIDTRVYYRGRGHCKLARSTSYRSPRRRP